MELVLFACFFAMLFYVVAQTVRVAQKSVSANKKPPSLPRLYSIPIELDVRKELEMTNIHDELVYRVVQEEPSQLALYVEGVTAYHARSPEVRFLLKTDDQQSIRVLCVELDTDYGVTPNLSALRYTPYLDAFLNRKIQAVRM